MYNIAITIKSVLLAQWNYILNIFSQQQQQQQRPDQQPQMPQQTGFPGPQQTMPNQPVQNPQGAQFGVKIDKR